MVIFCNDIHLLPLYGHLILFADNTTLINSQKTDGLLHFMMEHDSRILSEWFKANQLSLNISKMVLMQFWPIHSRWDIKIDGQAIPNVNEHKFLGVHINNKLNWNKHISMLYNKLQANKHLLWLATNLLDNDSLRALYYAHIYSHLRYGISSWGSMACAKNLKSLFQMQKQCIRTLYKRPKRSNINELFKRGRLLSIYDMIYLEMTVLGYKITHKMVPDPLVDIFNKDEGKKQHDYETRSKITPNIQKHHSVQFNKSFICRSLSAYMSLPCIIIQKPSLTSFTRGVKDHIINRY